MAVAVMGDFELEKIRAEIQQEKQMKEMLDQSTAELRFTIDELEKRFDGVVDEGNEWKTRCETQSEMNEQLERQILTLQNKVQEAKSNLKDGSEDKKDGLGANKRNAKTNVTWETSSFGNTSVPSSLKGSPTHILTTPVAGPVAVAGLSINIAISPRPSPAGKSPKDMKNFDDLSDANPQMVRILEKEKNMLHNQMRDIEWRLDQESKAYHKANDERKNYNFEISHAKQVMAETTGRQKASLGTGNLDPIPSSRTPREMGRTSLVTKRHQKKINSRLTTSGQSKIHADTHARLSNIPEDQRILDPKRGPIRKTAAVKSLPSLETS